MKKKFLCITMAMVFLFQGVQVFAMDTKLIFKEAGVYTANIYVCDTQNKEAILLNVKPLDGKYNAGVLREIEYKALPLITSRVYGTKGQNLSLTTINGYLLDSPVKVIIGKNGYGYRILRMELLR